MLIAGVRDFSIHGAKKAASTIVCDVYGRRGNRSILLPPQLPFVTL